MKYLDYYKKKGITEDKVFDYFLETIQPSIKNWEFFVNWGKVLRESNKLKVELNLLNSLIGSNNLKEDFIKLIQNYPEVIKTLPILLGVRESNLEIREFSNSKNLTCINFHFNKKEEITKDQALEYYEFLEKSKLINLFQNKRIKNFEDYVYGVEVGLDSNGRKNRGGHLMEDLVEFIIKPILKNKNLMYLKEANAKKIKYKWNIDINVNKSSRRFDFVIYHKEKKQLYIIETNFFNGGGSKPKSVCSEFKFLYDELKEQDIKFIWITDGKGWHKEKKPFEETFIRNEYVFNLNMISNGIIEDLLN